MQHDTSLRCHAPLTWSLDLKVDPCKQKVRGDFKHDYIIYSTAQNQIVSTAKADLVAYDYKEKKRQPVPEDWVF